MRDAVDRQVIIANCVTTAAVLFSCQSRQQRPVFCLLCRHHASSKQKVKETKTVDNLKHAVAEGTVTKMQILKQLYISKIYLLVHRIAGFIVTLTE